MQCREADRQKEIMWVSRLSSCITNLENITSEERKENNKQNNRLVMKCQRQNKEMDAYIRQNAVIVAHLCMHRHECIRIITTTTDRPTRPNHSNNEQKFEFCLSHIFSTLNCISFLVFCFLTYFTFSRFVRRHRVNRIVGTAAAVAVDVVCSKFFRYYNFFSGSIKKANAVKRTQWTASTIMWKEFHRQ